MIKQSFIEAAEILLPAVDLQTTLDFFSEKLGFRLLSIFPADAPHTALMTGMEYGCVLKKDMKVPRAA